MSWLRDGIHRTPAERQAHLAEYEAMCGTTQKRASFDFLYSNLTILDAKTAALLQFNGIGMGMVALQLSFAKNALSVTNQKPGQTTRVAAATLSEDGYVAIHDEEKGKPGKILGQSALLKSGTHTNISIPVAVKAEVYYWAMLHRDNGDGTYNPAQDLPIKDATGAIVATRYKGEEIALPKAEVAPKTYNVTIQNFAFSPKTLTVKKGDKIVVTNLDPVAHSMTSDGTGFDSGLISKGVSATIDTSALSGSYGFHCTPHPYMKATLIVQ